MCLGRRTCVFSFALPLQASPTHPDFVEFLVALLARRGSLFLASSAPRCVSPGLPTFSSSPCSSSGVSSFSRPAPGAKAFLPPPLAIAVFNLTLHRVSAAAGACEEGSGRSERTRREERDTPVDATRTLGPACLPPHECDEVLMRALLSSLSRNCSFFLSSSASTSSSSSVSVSSCSTSVPSSSASAASVMPHLPATEAEMKKNTRPLNAALLLASAMARFAHLARTGAFPFSTSSSPSTLDVLNWAVLWEEALLPRFHVSLDQASLCSEGKQRPTGVTAREKTKGGRRGRRKLREKASALCTLREEKERQSKDGGEGRERAT
ncbi:hypothetical protein NCLIV_024170 [Neospora caninum Liverpool]|uniref:Uncharacterized protein n=1 Tax=Neospora caninum (strain Liverpool) TaxID=572307 RepID=F0VFY5_NEOCL|nr:hypothetical protein NCLIV_024170 [Neospora caninum Liverpool]CBZ52629.1 hypothetical protein NCLIV_024170 [Neospora caninum Liverpool]|eukprot:XP_003882661.1 hypothetical protein NCLIV_024170 [Neospora caninum Liverpool]